MAAAFFQISDSLRSQANCARFRKNVGEERRKEEREEGVSEGKEAGREGGRRLEREGGRQGGRQGKRQTALVVFKPLLKFISHTNLFLHSYITYCTHTIN